MRPTAFFDPLKRWSHTPASIETMQPALSPEAEWLPFTIAAVRDETELREAVGVRQAAYARHLPGFAACLHEAEAADHAAGSVILLARSKLDGSALGSLRIQSNRFRPLELEESVALPAHLSGSRLAEATRLGVTQKEVGRLVKTALFKAFYLHCRQDGVDHMVITGRTPIDRQYARLLFEDVLEPNRAYPMRHVQGIPHRVMSLHVPSAEARWRGAGHPMLQFMCGTLHPDIQLPRRVLPRGILARMH